MQLFFLLSSLPASVLVRLVFSVRIRDSIQNDFNQHTKSQVYFAFCEYYSAPEIISFSVLLSLISWGHAGNLGLTIIEFEFPFSSEYFLSHLKHISYLI